MTRRRLTASANLHASPRLAGVLAALLLVGGCAVDQKKEVAKYRTVLDSAASDRTGADDSTRNSAHACPRNVDRQPEKRGARFERGRTIYRH